MTPKKIGTNGAQRLLPIRSMYGVFTYIWLIFMVNVGKYTIHGSYGLWISRVKEAVFVESIAKEMIKTKKVREHIIGDESVLKQCSGTEKNHLK